MFHDETRKKRTKSVNEAWTEWQSNVWRTSKCTLQFLSELRGTLHTKTTRKHIVNSHFAANFRLVSARLDTYFLKIYFYYCLLLWKYLFMRKLFLRLYDSKIIISSCVRIEYSTSMMQKCGLNWTLHKWLWIITIAWPNKSVSIEKYC